MTIIIIITKVARIKSKVLALLSQGFSFAPGQAQLIQLQVPLARPRSGGSKLATPPPHHHRHHINPRPITCVPLGHTFTYLWNQLSSSVYTIYHVVASRIPIVEITTILIPHGWWSDEQSRRLSHL